MLQNVQRKQPRQDLASGNGKSSTWPTDNNVVAAPSSFANFRQSSTLGMWSRSHAPTRRTLLGVVDGAPARIRSRRPVCRYPADPPDVERRRNVGRTAAHSGTLFALPSKPSLPPELVTRKVCTSGRRELFHNAPRCQRNDQALRVERRDGTPARRPFKISRAVVRFAMHLRSVVLKLLGSALSSVPRLRSVACSESRDPSSARTTFSDHILVVNGYHKRSCGEGS